MAGSMMRTAAVLGLLSTVGPFAIDMYLPALPAITEDLGATVAGTQGTLTAFFLAFGVSQLVYGPWADQAGRRVPLLFGLVLFLIGTLGCYLAPDIGTLTAARVVQGLGGAAVMVIPRAIIRDLHTGTEATRLMALIMLVISVSPMLAPLAGSLLVLAFDWRAIFVTLALAAGASIALTLVAQPETLPPERRVPVRLSALLSGTRQLLTDPVFLGLTFVGGFGMASFFVFIASASFVYAQSFGLSPLGFSLAFAVNAVGFFGASQLAAPLGARLGARRLVLLAAGGFGAATLVLLALTLAGLAGLGVIVGMLFVANACLGLVIPTTMVMALDDHGDIAGLASSLGGTLQMLAGGATIAATGPFFDGTPLPMILAIALCGVASAALAALVLSRAPVAPAT